MLLKDFLEVSIKLEKRIVLILFIMYIELICVMFKVGCGCLFGGDFVDFCYMYISGDFVVVIDVF